MPLVDLDDPAELRARWSALAAVAHATGFDRRWYADDNGWYHQDETGSDLRMLRLDGARAVLFGFHTQHSGTAGADLLAGSPEWIGQPEVKRRMAAGQLGFVYGSFNGTWARAAYPGDPWQPLDDGFAPIAQWVTSDEAAARELIEWAAEWTDYLGGLDELLPVGVALIRTAGSSGLTGDVLRDLFERLGIGPRSPQDPDLRGALAAAAAFGAGVVAAGALDAENLGRTGRMSAAYADAPTYAEYAEAPGYGQAETYGEQPEVYGEQPEYGEQPAAYGEQPEYGEQPRAYGEQPEYGEMVGRAAAEGFDDGFAGSGETTGYVEPVEDDVAEEELFVVPPGVSPFTGQLIDGDQIIGEPFTPEPQPEPLPEPQPQPSPEPEPDGYGVTGKKQRRFGRKKKHEENDSLAALGLVGPSEPPQDQHYEEHPDPEQYAQGQPYGQGDYDQGQSQDQPATYEQPEQTPYGQYEQGQPAAYEQPPYGYQQAPYEYASEDDEPGETSPEHYLGNRRLPAAEPPRVGGPVEDGEDFYASLFADAPAAASYTPDVPTDVASDWSADTPSPFTPLTHTPASPSDDTGVLSPVEDDNAPEAHQPSPLSSAPATALQPDQTAPTWPTDQPELSASQRSPFAPASPTAETDHTAPTWPADHAEPPVPNASHPSPFAPASPAAAEADQADPTWPTDESESPTPQTPQSSPFAPATPGVAEADQSASAWPVDRGESSGSQPPQSSPFAPGRSAGAQDDQVSAALAGGDDDAPTAEIEAVVDGAQVAPGDEGASTASAQFAAGAQVDALAGDAASEVRTDDGESFGSRGEGADHDVRATDAGADGDADPAGAAMGARTGEDWDRGPETEAEVHAAGAERAARGQAGAVGAEGGGLGQAGAVGAEGGGLGQAAAGDATGAGMDQAAAGDAVSAVGAERAGLGQAAAGDADDTAGLQAVDGDEVEEEEYYPTDVSPFAPGGGESPFATTSERGDDAGYGRELPMLTNGFRPIDPADLQPGEHGYELGGEVFHDELIGGGDWTADQLGDPEPPATHPTNPQTPADHAAPQTSADLAAPQSSGDLADVQPSADHANAQTSIDHVDPRTATRPATPRASDHRVELETPAHSETASHDPTSTPDGTSAPDPGFAAGAASAPDSGFAAGTTSAADSGFAVDPASAPDPGFAAGAASAPDAGATSTSDTASAPEGADVESAGSDFDVTAEIEAVRDDGPDGRSEEARDGRVFDADQRVDSLGGPQAEGVDERYDSLDGSRAERFEDGRGQDQRLEAEDELEVEQSVAGWDGQAEGQVDGESVGEWGEPVQPEQFADSAAEATRAEMLTAANHDAPGSANVELAEAARSPRTGLAEAAGSVGAVEVESVEEPERLVAPPVESGGMAIPGLGLVGADAPKVEPLPGSIEEAMRAEYERPRPRPKESAALVALREWCRARTKVVPSGFTIQVQVLDPGNPSYRFDLEPPEVDDPQYGAERLAELLGDLWTAESQSEQGAWLFARFDAAGRTLRIDRWYDQVPEWWDHPIEQRLDVHGLVRRLNGRGPDWQPSYLEKLYTTAR